MANVLHLDIVTPERRAFTGDVTEVVLPAWEGELGVYPDHDTMLALVRSGTCTVTSKGEVLRFVLGRGFAEISGTHVALLTDSCISAGEVDRPKAQADLERAEQELQALEPQSEKYRQMQALYEHARARLDA